MNQVDKFYKKGNISGQSLVFPIIQSLLSIRCKPMHHTVHILLCVVPVFLWTVQLCTPNYTQNTHSTFDLFTLQANSSIIIICSENPTLEQFTIHDIISDQDVWNCEEPCMYWFQSCLFVMTSSVCSNWFPSNLLTLVLALGLFIPP